MIDEIDNAVINIVSKSGNIAVIWKLHFQSFQRLEGDFSVYNGRNFARREKRKRVTAI